MIVQLKSITKHFGSTTALENINIDIGEGEFFFILGPSGCGKTTLLRLIAGFETPTSGDILFNKKSIVNLSPNKRNIGMVFQNYALWPHMSVLENICFGLNLKKIATDVRNKRISEVLKMVHLEGYENRYPNQLSGGQQQRVALARALVTRPDLLLLDEPLSNLDAKLRIEMRDELLNVQKTTGITTIYVTHDQKEALSMADRMMIIKDGKTMQIGNPFEIYKNPNSVFTAGFMGESNFIRGKILYINNSLIMVDTSLGLISGFSPMGNLEIGQTVFISIRPEAIKLKKENQNRFGAQFKGKVEKTVFLGEFEHFWLNANGLFLKMLLLNPTPDLHKTGIELELSVDEKNIIILPSKGDT